MTLYRMTPHGVLDMTNKNTGDGHGDASFVISKKTNAYQCREDPNSFGCSGLAQFSGDDANSTDVIVSLDIEVDGQWGPYMYCNPLNASREDTGPWGCDVSLSPGSGTKTPPQCKADNFTVFSDYCWSGFFPKKIPNSNEGDCCTEATKAGVTQWTVTADKTCELYKTAFYPTPCKGGVSGYGQSGPPACNCTRVHQTVGRENLTSGSYGSHYPAGGEWYSHPVEGECVDGHYVGDGSGCTWRVVKRNKVINATCMYGHIDKNVESHDPSCFSACPQPGNVTSNCYLKCYSDASQQMTQDQLAAPWSQAFASNDTASGGCPVNIHPF